MPLTIVCHHVASAKIAYSFDATSRLPSKGFAA